MLALDVTSEESVEATVQELIHTEGRIDLLVNNASGLLDSRIRKDLKLDLKAAS
jgi:NAD(P)-dependent dehydrogenase (short-subunit alcohol dehydrogenase family)